MGRNIPLTLTKSKESVQAFMEWVNCAGTDTHNFISLLHPGLTRESHTYPLSLPNPINGNKKLSRESWLHCETVALVKTLEPQFIHM